MISTEEPSFEIKPINSSCSNIENKDMLKPAYGSTSDNMNKDISNLDNQANANAQYDNVDSMEVKPLYGGYYLINYSILFRKNIYKINSDSEINAIKLLLNNKIYKRDYFLEISNKNKKSVYIIRGNYKNKFSKI